MPGRILVVDDELSMRDFLSIFLRKEGYNVECAESGREALTLLKQDTFDLVISDVRMSNMDGMQLLKESKRLYPTLEFLIMTAFSSTSDAITAMRDGAYDYITKPFKVDEIKITIEKALEKRRIASENVQLRQELRERNRISNIIGNSAPMVNIYDMVGRVADTKTTVLITGESGTGKELVARAMHYNSIRAEAPFVTINCGAIPAELMESELFGHIKGSFTGAVRDKEGLFATASKGTLFLDEVAEIPMLLQVKLLRALQERRIMPVGGNNEIKIDTRVIAATNRDLIEEVAANRFREDLYYRLNVIHVRVPPLRERRDDIPLLVQHFVEKNCQESGRQPMAVSEAAMMILQEYDYPGNVRELANLIERAVALETSDQIRPQSLPNTLLETVMNAPEHDAPRQEVLDFNTGVDLDALMAKREREVILQALEHTGGVKNQAAKVLGITFRSLRYRLDKLGIENDTEEDDA